MEPSKLRRKIAWEAARLIYDREATEYYHAKRKASRRIATGWVRPADLPSNAEIRDQVRLFARMIEGDRPHQQRLQEMRMRALWWLDQLQPFHPRLIGSVLTGHIRDGSDIDIHVFSGSPTAVANRVADTGNTLEIERKRLVKEGETRVFTHIHVRDQFPVELTIYHPSLLGHRFRSSIDGKPIPKATAADLRKILSMEHGWEESDVDAALEQQQGQVDRWQLFECLLLPLERVKENPKYHPEGDALYHSLQVFELARERMPYDEEFLLAALLHDVGKAIDKEDHVAAGLEALEGFITDRTAWLIANHMLGHRLKDGSLGARARRRLREHPLYEDLEELTECDEAGRCQGAQVAELDAALDYIRSLETMFET